MLIFSCYWLFYFIYLFTSLFHAKIWQKSSASVSSSKGKSPQDVKGTTKQQQFSRLNNLTRTSVKCNNQTQDANGQGQGPNPGEVTEGSARKQLSPEDQQQLVELVQENMERNHVKQLRWGGATYQSFKKKKFTCFPNLNPRPLLDVERGG